MTDNASRKRNAEGYEPRFDVDLEYGKQAELFVTDVAQAITTGMVEVKRDAQAMKTGNIYVEYACRHADGKWHPSGIATTDATLYVFVFGETETAIVIPTQLLREFLRPANKPEAGNHRDDIRRKQLDHMRKKLERGSHPTKGFAIPLVTLFAWLKEHQQNVRRGVA